MKNKKPVVLVMEGQRDRRFESISAAARFLGVANPTMHAALKRGGTCKGYKVKYAKSLAETLNPIISHNEEATKEEKIPSKKKSESDEALLSALVPIGLMKDIHSQVKDVSSAIGLTGQRSYDRDVRMEARLNEHQKAQENLIKMVELLDKQMLLVAILSGSTLLAAIILCVAFFSGVN